MRVAFDVDGTLYTFAQTANKEMLSTLLLFCNLGCDVVIWSSKGKQYAEDAAYALGVSDRVQCLSKGDIAPDLTFDDENIPLGRTNILVPLSYQVQYLAYRSEQ